MKNRLLSDVENRNVTEEYKCSVPTGGPALISHIYGGAVLKSRTTHFKVTPLMFVSLFKAPVGANVNLPLSPQKHTL